MVNKDSLRDSFQRHYQRTYVDHSVCIELVFAQSFEKWFAKQNKRDAQQLKSHRFVAEAGQLCLLLDNAGNIDRVCAGMGECHDFWRAGSWVKSLPDGVYHLHPNHADQLFLYALGWGLGAYAYTRYCESSVQPNAKLMLDKTIDQAALMAMLSSIYWVRDLINTPAQDCMPDHLALEAKMLARQHGARCKVIVGDRLLKANYPTVHAVGRASQVPPHLIDITWGNPKHPKLTLVGKGVCFDSGGLDIKPAAGMLIMKKDMGGSAHVLALAHLIMSQRVPVRLRVLVPAVENAISANAYRPGDVIKTRSGLTVEVGNTDAEGRLILADALSEASAEEPDLIIDFATLTGAQRVALGEDLPGYFTGSAVLIDDLMRHSEKVQDPAWPLPLYKPYMSKLKSSIADMGNISSESPYGGAIVAALFLSRFVWNPDKWVHIDLNAWNASDRPGRPKGGEAMGLRMIFSYLVERYGKK